MTKWLSTACIVIISSCIFLLVTTIINNTSISQTNLIRSSSSIIRRALVQQQQQQTIIGGTAAGTNEFPWYAKFEGRILCGGSVITDRNNTSGQFFVLTAAHCVDDGYTPSQVRVGSTSFSSGGTLYRVTQKFLHPNYTGTSGYNNDIALLKIASPCVCCFCNNDPATLSLNINASIPAFHNQDLTVMGFGITDSNNQPSSRLNKLTVQYVSNDICQADYGTFRQDIKLCADKTNAGVCAGDSGGPLLVRDTIDESWSQVGIVSVGRQGCASPFPDYYTRVSSYASDWIQSTIDNELSLYGMDRESMLGFLKLNARHWISSLIWN